MRLFRIILQTKPDCIHFLWTHQVPILLAPFLKRFPVAYTAHDPVLHPGEAGILRGWIHGQHIKMAKICFVHGEENKQKLIQNYGVDPKSVYVIPHGEFVFWENLPPVEQEKRILFFGRIRKYKGIEVLLDAFEKVSPCIPDYRLSICGKGNLGNLSFRIRSMPNVDLENRFINHEEIPSLFLRSRFLILPYIDATQSGVVPMAFALGRTCIVSAVGSMPEIVCHEDNGLLVQPGEPNELAAAMLKLAQDDTLLRHLEQGASNAAHNSDSFSWNHAARIAAAAYQSSMGS